MPDWAIPILEQVPWGAVIIILLWLVKGYQETRDKLFAQSLSGVSAALGANTVMLGEIRGVWSRINGQDKG